MKIHVTKPITATWPNRFSPKMSSKCFPKYKLHPYVTRLPNGNTLILCKGEGPAECLADVKNVDIPWFSMKR